MTKTDNVKTWWKLLKQVFNADKNLESILNLCYSNNVYESDSARAEVFNKLLYHSITRNCSSSLSATKFNQYYSSRCS